MLTTIRRFIHRLLSAVRFNRAEAELRREIDSHLEMLAERFRAQGMSPGDAHLAARRAFGGVEQAKEHQRDTRSFRWLDDSRTDFKLGIRMLVKHPGLSIVGGLGLAVAIAMSAGSFAFFYSYLYSTLPVEDGHRIVALENWDVVKNNEERRSLHDYFLWRDEMKSMENLGAFRTISRNLIVPGGSAEPIQLAEITASAFRIARVPALVGRTIVEQDERGGSHAAIVLGYNVWQSRFGGDRGVIGRAVRIGNRVHIVIGVMPEGFAFPVDHDYWVPMRVERSQYARREGPEIFIFGRLGDGASVEAAQAELTMIGLREAAASPGTHTGLRPQVMPYAYPILDVQDMSLWQVGAMQLMMSMLLLIVAVNVAILVYARTATRQGELAVRTALGASRRRIVGQLFIESLVLCAGAALAGLVFARFGLRLGHQIMESEGGWLPYWIDLGVPPLTVAYVAALGTLAAVIAGVLPALHATGPRMQATLRELGGNTGLRLGRTWTILIVSQVALTVAGLPIAVATGWQAVGWATTKPVFTIEEYLATVVRTDPDPPAGVDAVAYQRESKARFESLLSELVARLESEAAVADVTFATALPGGESRATIEVDGVDMPATGAPEVRSSRVAPDYFNAFDAGTLIGTPLPSVDAAGSGAVIVNRAFVRQVLGDGDPLGRRFRYVTRRDGGASGIELQRWYEIAGVANDLLANAVDPVMVQPTVFHPMALPDVTSPVTLIVLVGGGTPSTFIGRLREIAAALDPTIRLSASPMVEMYRQQDFAVRLVLLVVILIVTSVLLLSAAGIYALMSFTVSQRRKEIGIRAALGADSQRLLQGIFSRAALQLAMGVAVGIALAVVLNSASDGEMLGNLGPVLLPAMSLVMIAVGLLATLGPARRGLRIDPVQALRQD